MNAARPVTAEARTLRQSQFELSVALTLFTWPALTLAVKENWGGPDSAGKREWFGGAIVELFPSPDIPNTPQPIVEDVEDRLLQIMEDEFEVVVDDGSPAQLAQRIMVLWRECMEGDFARVQRLQEEYSKKGQGKEVIARAGAGSDDEESVDDESGEDEDEDVEMGGVPLRQPREKELPQVDEEGFTSVVGRKNRGR